MGQKEYTVKGKKWKQLTEKERYKIEALLERKIPCAQIALQLGKSRRTIERERSKGLVAQKRCTITSTKDCLRA